MFYKRLILTVFFAAVILPAPLNAQVSQTTAFTLSVTIPERAQMPSATSVAAPIAVSSPALAYFQAEIRDNVLVYVASYVVD